MILLVTASERTLECSAALNKATGEEVLVAESLVRATALLRVESYLAVVLDQNLLEARPHEAATTFEHLGNAIPVQINFGISGMERLVRDFRAAVRRRQHEEAGARQAAMGKLHGELNGTVTALLLSSELALEDRSLPPAAAEKLRSVYEMVKRLRQQLEIAIPTEEAKQRAPGA